MIGRTDLGLLVVGSVIGSGIFLVPGGVLSQSGGTIGVALLVWLIGGVLTVLGALTYGELGAMNPGAGGLYLFIRDAFGPLPAFLYGWSLFFAISAGGIATLVVAASGYMQQFLPIGEPGRRGLALLIIAGLAALNVRGTRVSIRFLNAATALKVAALGVLIVVLPFAGKGLAGTGAWWPTEVTPGLLQAAGLAMIAVLWAYEGWQYATFVAGEVIDPQRNFPVGLAAGTLTLTLIYVLANVGYLVALGPRGVAESNRVAADAVAATLGPGFATAIAIPIVIAMISAAHSIVLTSSRVYFAMARDGVFFARLADIHPRYQTPAFSVLAGSAVAAVLSLLGTFQELLSFVVFVGWIFYGLAGASVFVFRRRQPDALRPFRVPGYPWTPALFAASAAGLVANAIASQPTGRTTAALGILAAGVPAYLLWRRRAVRAG
jgi:APA family basic amino acid/polyamine antiporter